MNTGASVVPTVRVIESDGSDLDGVVALYKRNSGTLGFFPRGAFKELVDKGTIVAAYTNGELDGYASWHVTKRDAVLVHLCVRQERRGSVAAALLLEAVITETQHLDELRLSCRKEYGANRLWPQHGFTDVAERPGRGKHATPLLIWSRKQSGGEAPLLASIREFQRGTRKTAAIDANVFYDIEQDREHSEESRSLLADWLEPDVLIAVTAELRNEIARQEDDDRRQEARLNMASFYVLEGDPQRVKDTVSILSRVLPAPTNERDESDRRQLAHAVVKEAEYFVTRDGTLLDHADELKQAVGIDVMRPADFIVRLHEEGAPDEYTPSRLVGTTITQRRPNSASELHPFQRFGHAESKVDWHAQVRRFLADPHRFETTLIEPPAAEPRILIIIDTRASETLSIEVLRALSHPLTPTLLRRRLSEVLVRAHNNGQRRVVCRDVADNLVDSALRSLGFSPTPEGFAKGSVRAIVPADDVASTLGYWFPADSGIGFSGTPTELEAALWPLKVVGAGIPAYVVPVQPHWASELFDASLADRLLFGPRPDIALALENVYYSASAITIPAGARILWYVSGKGKQRVGEVRAASICQETMIDTASALFRRFKRLGTYRWPDVLGAAGDDPHGELRAYRFALTERFATPVSYARLQEVLNEHLGHGNQIPGPLAIPEVVFVALYRAGSSANDKSGGAS